MASPLICEFGWKATDFLLPATNDRFLSLADISGTKGTLIAFICNHCPYVIGVLDRIIRDFAQLQEMGIGVAAISSNDAHAYPQDSFENMKQMAKVHSFSFPYLYDEDQSVGRSYGAICTPDFFGFNADQELQYRGRLDSARNGPVTEDTRRELIEAMVLIARTGRGPAEQIPSVGCSIKWKEA